MSEIIEQKEDKQEKAEFKIFGEADIDSHGKIRSQYPSWYFDHLKEELQNDISVTETMLKFDRIPKSEVAITQERLAQKKEKLKSLEKSCLELRGKVKDKIAKIRSELGEAISELQYSRSDMMKGLASAREEARRMTEPMIPVTGDSYKFAQACNVRVIKGKVTRNGAEKMWKIASKALGDCATNVESLRKD